MPAELRRTGAFIEDCLRQLRDAKQKLGSLEELNTSQIPLALRKHLQFILRHFRESSSLEEDVQEFTGTVLHLCELATFTEIEDLPEVIVHFLSLFVERVKESRMLFKSMSLASRVSEVCRVVMNMDAPPSYLANFLLEITCLLRAEPGLTPLYYNVQDHHLSDFPIFNAILVLVDRYGSLLSYVVDRGSVSSAQNAGEVEATAKKEKKGGGIFGGLIASVTSTLSSFGQGAAPLTTRAHREAVARAIRRKKSRLALCHLLCLPDEEISAFILSKRILEDIASALAQAFHSSLSLLVAEVTSLKSSHSSFRDGVFDYSRLSLNFDQLDVILDVAERVLTEAPKGISSRLRSALFDVFFSKTIAETVILASDNDAVHALVVLRVMLLRGTHLAVENLFGEFLREVPPISKSARDKSQRLQGKLFGMIQSSVDEVALEALCTADCLLSSGAPHMAAHFVLRYLVRTFNDAPAVSLKEHVENILPPVLSEILPLVPTEGVDSASLALFSVEWRSLWESAMALESESSVAALAMSPSSTLSVIPESRRGVRGGGANSESERSGNGERSTRSAEREEVASTNPSDRCASSPSRPGLSLLAGEEVAEEGTALQPNDYFLQSLMDSFDGFLSRSPAVIAMQTCIFSKVASVPHRCIGAFFCSQVEEAMGPLSYLEEILDSANERIERDPTLVSDLKLFLEEQKRQTGDSEEDFSSREDESFTTKEAKERSYFVRNVALLLSFLQFLLSAKTISDGLSAMYPPLHDDDLQPSTKRKLPKNVCHSPVSLERAASERKREERAERGAALLEEFGLLDINE